ncbi:MAG TPA: hypothetical protein VJZ27_06975, partial [Aggregatilineales bacterium]|nr:hypothetical protein [Aggregatilineales bacterium]
TGLIIWSVMGHAEAAVSDSLRQVALLLAPGVMTGFFILIAIYPHLLPRLLLSGLSVFIVVLLLEIGLRVYMDAFPIYVTQAYQANADIGWTLVPNSEREHSTGDPTCVSFRNIVKANSSGFFDREHSSQNPENAFRIAVLGDSIIMAQEVSLDEKATSLLEKRLNESSLPPQYEVLNLGVSSFSVGQYLPTYEVYARPFAPRVVFILISELQMERTQLAFHLDIPGEQGDPIAVELRPLFELDENGVLQHIPTRNAEAAREIFETRLDENGQPVPRKITRAPVINPDATPFNHPYVWLSNHSQLLNFIDRRLNSITFSFYSHLTGDIIPASLTLAELDPRIDLALHHALLREIAEQVAADGGRLVLIDNSENSSLRDELARFAESDGSGYINLAAAIDTANRHGTATRFLCDSHFNTAGHKIMADLMFDWLQTHIDELN